MPNDVLSLRDYQTVMDTSKTPEERLSAFARRLDWFRIFGNQSHIAEMITKFDVLGIIEERKGPDDLPGVPSRIWVESAVDVPVDGLAEAPTAAESFPAGRKLRSPGKYGR